MSVDANDLHALEVALRDSRNMGVIRAVSRLSVMPTTQDQLHAALQDMRVVKAFIEERIPAHLRPVATEVFLEHSEEIQRVFREAQKTK